MEGPPGLQVARGPILAGTPTATAAIAPTATAAIPAGLASAPIDLAMALALAADRPNAVRTARARLAEAEARADLAGATLLPSLALGGQFARHEGTIQDVAGSFFDTDRQRLFLGLTGEATLDVGGGVYAFLASRRLRDAAGAEVESTTQERLASAAQSYLDLVAAQAGLTIAAQAIAAAQELQETARVRERLDAGLLQDRLLADAELARARSAEVTAVERFRVASARLATALRLDPTTVLVSSDREARPITFVPPDAPLGPLVEEALGARPDLRAAESRVLAAEAADTGATVGPFVPTLRAGAGGLNGGVGYDGPTPGKLDDRTDWYVGVEWRLTGLGFGEVARARAAEARLAGERIDADDLRERIARDVVEAHAAIRGRAAAIGLAGDEIAAAEEARAVAVRRLARGAGLTLDVLMATERRERAATRLVEAIVDYDKAQFRLLWRLGARPGG